MTDTDTQADRFEQMMRQAVDKLLNSMTANSKAWTDGNRSWF
ncbi:Uncharacterised protein [Neisseria gonorrhoeae]|uniref:Uncharacterized protein n=1 Tax=Neisseria gonorrhoeae TaxID=485 RepID=A0A378W0A6_NEIGO|nr:Uncharacterised protein [Neisseria gonorrhoeae]